ncbi:MAG: LysE family transporter [Candidatus Hodarchaeales archaeon]
MSFIEVFVLAFLVALTGAMSPGPLLTYTIYKSIQTKTKSYLVGIFICLGHAILEFGIILVLLLGVGPFITSRGIILLIGLIGGGILIFFGLNLLRDVIQDKVDIDVLSLNEEMKESFVKHPIFGGIFISMSNPYWWLWWAVIGMSFMTQFSVSVTNIPEFWGFFLGHELGDYAWYGSISIGLGITNNFITKNVYKIIISCCSVFMIGFGLYLAISPLFFM